MQADELSGQSQRAAIVHLQQTWAPKRVGCGNGSTQTAYLLLGSAKQHAGATMLRRSPADRMSNYTQLAEGTGSSRPVAGRMYIDYVVN